jgi:hypothetical protein
MQVGVHSGGGGSHSWDVNLNSVHAKRFFLYLKRIGFQVPVSDFYLAEVQNDLAGFYYSSAENCSVMVMRAKLKISEPPTTSENSAREGLALGRGKIEPSCQLPSRFYCADWGCQAGDGTTIGQMSGLGFTLNRPGQAPQTFVLH